MKGRGLDLHEIDWIVHILYEVVMRGQFRQNGEDVGFHFVRQRGSEFFYIWRHQLPQPANLLCDGMECVREKKYHKGIHTEKILSDADKRWLLRLLRALILRSVEDSSANPFLNGSNAVKSPATNYTHTNQDVSSRSHNNKAVSHTVSPTLLARLRSSCFLEI